MIGYNFLIGNTKRYKSIPMACYCNADEQKMVVCEKMMGMQIAFSKKLGMQDIADHCVRLMEDYRKKLENEKKVIADKFKFVKPME